MKNHAHTMLTMSSFKIPYFLYPNQFIPPIGFTFVGPIFNFMKGYSTSLMIQKMIICVNVNIKIGLLYIPNFSHLTIKLGKTITIPLHQTASYFTMGLIRF
jgi:hypothetical protein